ncbi:MAG: zinc ribbon domain-containing protein [Desulfobacteraceae bacterium]|nr:zinc ribbon domain-containing protein [Desulfobacteraceae bacterium]
MPIYEYECSACGEIEEVFQKMSDPPLKECSKCKGKLNKLISHSSFHLKGSGWYVTDYGGAKGGSKSNPENSSSSNSVKTKNKVLKPACKKEAASKK